MSTTAAAEARADTEPRQMTGSPDLRMRRDPAVASLRERSLFRRYRDARHPAIRDEIVARHLGLAAHVAARYERTSVPYEDRMQIACLGLLKALERFDPDRGFAFSSFAVPTMIGELRRHFRQHTWTVRPPRGLQERVRDLERATADLSGELGRSPTPRELAETLDLTVDQVLEAIEAACARSCTSLDEPVGREDDAPLAATIGEEDPGYDRVDDAITADRLLAELTPRQERILRLRFEEDLTQSAIGVLEGCSQMTVSRIIRDALGQLTEVSEPPDRSPAAYAPA